MIKKIFFIFALMLVLTACTTIGSKEKENTQITPEEAKTKAMDFITGNMVKEGTSVSIESVTEENGLYKMSVDVEGQKIDSYLSKDGEMFFPQGVAMKDFEEETGPSGEEASTGKGKAINIPKKAKPEVELFVMSHCPYGTQIEKGIIPAVETLGDTIDFQLKFVDYAMHGQKEIDEQMTQYCVQEQGEEKILSYLKCFLADEASSEKCLDQVGVNKGELDSCVQRIDSEYKINENFADKDTWKGRYPTFNTHKEETDRYDVGGSPTLVINGETARPAGRDSANLLAAICSGFEEAPDACNAELSTASPAPGFGYGGSGANTDASCN